MNLEDQYDRIFKYLYFHLHDRHMAEDMTQEAFWQYSSHVRLLLLMDCVRQNFRR